VDEPLNGLIREETLAEIVRLLEPREVLVALLRLEGLADREIAELLGVERSTVTWWMLRARRRIAQELPHAAGWLAGRRRGAEEQRRGDVEV
jgi:DNA-directed RNA polymerase specialized sigma24 family protein